MKANKVVLWTVLTTLLTFPALGQYESTETMKKQDPAKKDMPMMKPAFESTVEGTHLKVWVMTEKDHEKMMKSQEVGEKMDMNKTGEDAKSSTMGMDKGHDMTTMMKGTHHLKVEATDESSGSYAKELTGTVTLIAPSKKSASVELKPAMNHAGCDITLNEKGEYQFSLDLKVDGKTRTAKFEYTPQATSAMNEEE
jgi:hypothetical protein